jgi:dTDP-4-amino-4,6-dideoxygalactose transaminase
MMTFARIRAAFDAADLPQRADLVLERIEHRTVQTAGPVRFIENKAVDYAYLEQLLERSRRANHFTNFGPVAHQLEQVLKQLWSLPADRTAVFASSATSALFALAGVHAAHVGHRLRFATCTFGFMATNIGPLCDTVLCDSNVRGMLDLDAITDNVRDSIDGLIVINIFGMNSDLEDYRAYCKEHGKILIIDNATGFGGFDRSQRYDEVVSFHHTKAWGVGEGGIAVIAAEDENLFRALLSFGTGAADWLRFYASNAKISDFSAGLILDRLARMPIWGAAYKLQEERMSALAAAAGLVPLSQPQADELHAHLPFQADRPVDELAVAAATIPLKKYYKPLDEWGNMANRIYANNLCIPVHTGMTTLADADVANAVKGVLS